MHPASLLRRMPTLVVLLVAALAAVAPAGVAGAPGKDYKQGDLSPSGDARDVGLDLLDLAPLFKVGLTKKGKKKRIRVSSVSAEDLSAKQFYFKYVANSLPVVIRNATDAWPARTKWLDNEYLRKTVGENELTVEVSQDDNFVFYGQTYASEEMKLGDFLNVFDKQDRTKNYYIAQQDVEKDLPQLKADIKRPDFTALLDYDETLFWMGSGGQRTPIHYDDAENLLTLIDGTKKIRLYDPSQSNFLYPIERDANGGLTLEVNITDPDLDKYPLFSKAVGIDVELHAGDMLYMPAYWWHEVVSVNRNVAVNFWFHCHSKLVENFFAVFEDRVVARTKAIRAAEAASKAEGKEDL